jgi:hypothetical protein
LIRDIADTNKLSFEKNETTKSILDYLTTHILSTDAFVKILQKNTQTSLKTFWDTYRKSDEF